MDNGELILFSSHCCAEVFIVMRFLLLLVIVTCILFPFHCWLVLRRTYQHLNSTFCFFPGSFSFFAPLTFPLLLLSFASLTLPLLMFIFQLFFACCFYILPA